jgi:hypothetical protein
MGTSKRSLYSEETIETEEQHGFDYANLWEEADALRAFADRDSNLPYAKITTNEHKSRDKGEQEKEDEGEEEEEEEQKEEVHGEYERDEDSERVPGLAKKSFLRNLEPDDHQRFLAQAPMTRGDALRNMNPIERMIFDFLIILTPIILLSKIWQFPQKSGPWLWARTGRLTGSHTGVAVGHQRGTPVMRGPYESTYMKFKGNKASMWGSGKEVYATQCYVNDLKRLVTTVFREQRKSGAIQATMADGEHDGYFIFRNQKIPVADINDEPSVEVRHYGLLIDPWNHNRGVSPDGVVFINGVAVGVLEVKCPDQGRSLYLNIKPYYFDQIMSEMYIGHLYWPTIHWVDYVVWSPRNFTVDTFTFDARYYYGWYGPRELKYYYRLYLKTLGEKMYLLAQQETQDITPNDETIRKVIEREFTMPKFQPPPVVAPPPSHTVFADDSVLTTQSGQGQMHSISPTKTSIDPDFERQLLEMDLDFECRG